MTGRSYFYEKPATENDRRVFFSTSYLPSIAMFYDVVSAMDVGKYALDTEEVYVKQTFRNRTFILSSQGMQILTIPVIKKTGQKTKDVKIFNDIRWQDNHWKTLKTCYNNSPFFIHYSEQIKKIYDRNFVFLLDLNSEFLSFLLNKINLPSRSKVGNRANNKADDKAGNKADNMAGSMDYKSEATWVPKYITTFNTNGVTIKQLSILDLLFNTGNEAANYLSQCQH